jgi:hypothetical protein
MSMTPKARLINRDVNATNRFELTVRDDYMTLADDGTVTLMLSRGDVNNLHIDCSQALLDDDVRLGVITP